MAKREVTVVINGEEYVSKAAQEAEAGLTGFAGFMDKLKGKLVPVVDVTKLVEMAVRALSAAFDAAKQFVMDSIGAYDRYVTAQTKLAAQSKLTGVSMKDMNALVDTARERFGLGTVAAVDIAAAVAKFASQSGDAAKASQLMAAALELGAASGMDAAQVAEGLSSALAGNDEWLNRLGLSNPSQLWKDYADANGLAVAKMSDTEKKLAVMTALMDAGGKVTGVYAERLASGAGAQERLNNNLDTAKTMFGAAIQPIRILVIDGLTALLNVIGPLLIALAYLASGVVEALVAPFKLAQSAIGSVVEVAGRLTGNKALEEWGKKNARAFEDYTDGLAKWVGISKPATEAVEKQGKAHQMAAVHITASADAVKKHAETTEEQMTRLNAVLNSKLGEPMRVAIGLTESAVTRLGQAAVTQLSTEQSQKFLTHMQGLADAAEASRLRMIGVKDVTEKGGKNTKDMAREVETFARGALDAAGSFGIIDETAQRSLNSAISIASAVGNIAKSGFSFAGVTGVLGGVANIVSTMMQGDAERKRLLAQNNDALDRLRKGIGGLKLNITGEDFQNAQTALGSVVGQLRGGRGAANENDVRNALYAQGLTMADFDRIAKEFGIEVRTKSGALNVDSVKAVLEALNTVQFGSVGKGFADQLEFFRNSQRVNGADGAGGLQALIEFLRTTGNVRALEGVNVTADPQAALQQLRALFAQLGTSQGLGAAQLGRLTGSQFSDLLMELIGGLTSGAPSTGGGTVTVDTGTGSGGTVTVPTDTVQSVIKAMDANLANILTSHTVIHERIAVATESSAASLQSIDEKMDTLIAVSSGTDRIDRALEAERFALAVQQGRGVTFG